MKALWRLGRLFAGAWPGMAVALLFAWLTSAAAMGLLAAAAWLLATAALQPHISVLSLAIAGVRFFSLARAACRYGERYFAHGATFRLLARLRVWLYRRLEPLAPGHSAAALLTRLVGDVEVLRDIFLRAFLPPAAAGLACLLFALAAAPAYGGWPAAVVLGCFLLAAVALPLWLSRAWRQGGRELAARRETLQAAAADLLAGRTELWAFRRLPDQAQRLAAAASALAAAQRRQSLRSGAGEAFGLAVGYGAVWLLLWGGLPLVRAAAWSGVDLAVLTLATLALGEMFLLLPAAARYLADGAAAAERLWETASGERPSEGVEDCPAGELQVENLTFAYPGAVRPALQDVSFSLHPGRTVAVVGASGAGKSTLASLLLGFCRPQGGRVLLGGAELRRCSEESWRGHFAVVPQRPYFFRLSLADNLRVARPGAGEAQLLAALEQARLGAWLAAQPRGLETAVGEGGSRLSGGQRQRLAVARALLKEASYWLLDEPTAGLDAATAAEVAALLRDVTRGKGVLWITHRLQGLDEVDEILVLQAGRVAERGTMAQLLARQGLFYQLWTAERDKCI